MRLMSANTIKANARGKRSKQKRDVPDEGSLIRLLWDVLHANKGRFVPVSGLDTGYNKHSLYAARGQLTDFWGLDIAYKPGKKGPKGYKEMSWCLVGEWFGKDYVDYLAERHHEKV